MNPSSHEKSRQHQGCGALLLLALCLLLVACGSTPVQPKTSAHGASCPSISQLLGAGSTFDAPLFARMFTAYKQTPCGLAVTYLGGGSAAGMNALLDQSVDFAATDVPLTDAAEARSTHGAILHIPITLGTEAIIYQVPGVPSLLKLTGPVLADIFLGKITTWNDPAITALNPGLALPDLPMTVLHRSDGSGTTGIFSHYLSLVSPTWKSEVGAAVSVTWYESGALPWTGPDRLDVDGPVGLCPRALSGGCSRGFCLSLAARSQRPCNAAWACRYRQA